MATRVETVRFYEKEGLLPAPEQNSGNYRIYRQAHLNRLSFIRRSRDLGFLLDQMRTILKLADKRDASCAQVGSITAINIAEINRKVTNLSALRAEQVRRLENCEGSTIGDCRIIGALAPAGVYRQPK